MVQLSSVSTAEPDAVTLAMHHRLLEACEAEYEQLSQIFQALDSKAQSTSTMAGAFLAAAFAFFHDVKPQLPPLHLYKYFFAGGLGMLLMAECFALLALWRRGVYNRPPVEFIDQLIRDLVKKEGAEPIGARAPGFFRDEAAAWIPAIKRMRVILKLKSRLVGVSQLCMLGALVCVSILLTVRLWA